MNNTRLVGLGGLLLLIMGSLGGCAAPVGATPEEGALDESVGQTSAALTTNPFTLHNYQTGRCLGVAAGTPTPGTPLVVWTCDQSANQTWERGSGSSAPWLGNHVAAQRCLRAEGSSNGSKADIYNCVFSGFEQWSPIFVGNDLNNHECYNFESVAAPGKVFGVAGGSTANGASVVIWTNFHDQFGHPDQIWCVY